jgi:hypothetical protein
MQKFVDANYGAGEREGMKMITIFTSDPGSRSVSI